MTHWTIKERRSVKGEDQHRFNPGDRVETDRSGADKYLVVTPEDVRDPSLNVHLEGDASNLSFARGRGRGNDPGDRFNGQVRYIELGGVAVLVGLIGYKASSPTGEDDDTEVFVATHSPDLGPGG